MVAALDLDLEVIEVQYCRLSKPQDSVPGQGHALLELSAGTLANVINTCPERPSRDNVLLKGLPVSIVFDIAQCPIRRQTSCFSGPFGFELRLARRARREAREASSGSGSIRLSFKVHWKVVPSTARAIRRSHDLK
jgi:hypothetical protein